MNSANRSPRFELARETVILQLKLLVDGLRDALLIPLSIAAAIFGILRGGDDCDREFRRVITLGVRSERWIDLFGHQRRRAKPHSMGSMDAILDQVESTVIKQYRKSAKATQPDSKESDPEG